MVSLPNTNILLAVGGIVAAVFLVSQIRKAGADVVGALPTIDEGLRESLTDITSSIGTTAKNFESLQNQFIQFQTDAATNLSQFKSDTSDNLKSITDFFGNLFKTQQEELSQLAGQTVSSGDSTIFIPPDTVINPDGTSSSDTPPLLDLSESERLEALRQLEINRQRSIKEQELSEIPASEDISGAELASAINEAEFQRRLDEESKPFDGSEGLIGPIQEISTETQQGLVLSAEEISSSPAQLSFEQILADAKKRAAENLAAGEIPGFVNPIDTLGEVIELFPQLTASQAADFLMEHSGISPSDALLVDPDIKNIVANVGGENIPVENVTISKLDEQAQIAACTTCDLFGLNCDICQGNA